MEHLHILLPDASSTYLINRQPYGTLNHQHLVGHFVILSPKKALGCMLMALKALPQAQDDEKKRRADLTTRSILLKLKRNWNPHSYSDRYPALLAWGELHQFDYAYGLFITSAANAS